MLQYFLLALLGICATHAQKDPVNIQYNSVTRFLRLSLSGVDPSASRVDFFYRLGLIGHEGIGRHSGSGEWVYEAPLLALQRETIHANARIHYPDGHTETTPEATHNIGAILPLGSRRIRAVFFRDDFNNYNHNNWRPEVSMFGGMNWEFQVYTPEARNIYAANGNLYLRPTLTTDDPRFNENFLHNGHMDVKQIWGVCTNDGNYGCVRDGKNGLLPPVMSGKVSSNPTARFATVEVRAKIPQGDWLWPAIWMMPSKSVYGGWPRSGEIDIMESRGNGGDIGVNTVSSTLHWGPSWDQNRYGLTHGERHNGNFHNDFHTWRLDWTGDHLRTYVDNNLILDVNPGSGFWNKGGFSGANIWGSNKMAPFDQDFFLMFNVAVGGTNGFFPDNVNYGVKKPWANNSPHAAEDFWNARGQWLPTWHGDQAALIIDYAEFRN